MFGSSVKGRLEYLYYSRLISRQLLGQGTLRKSPEHIRADLERDLDAAEEMLDVGPCLFGEQRYLCDFAILAQLNYLNRTPVGGRAIRKRERLAGYVARIAALPSQS